MAEAPTNDIFCTICQEDDISKHASVWCFECEDFLCPDCSRVHRRSKSLKEHKLTTIEDYRNLPQFVLDIKNRCSEHDEKYELYCSVHESACCIKCSQEEHKECRELRPIREVLENFKSSAAVSHLEEDLQKIEKNFNKVVNYLKSRHNKNQEQSSEILKEIRRIRGDVNAHFDKIEQKIVNELKSEQKSVESKLDRITKEVEEKSRQIISIREDFSKMTRHATALQTYIALKKIESAAMKEESYLFNLVDNDSDMNETTLEMEVSRPLKTLVHDVASFGKIFVRSSKSTLLKNIKVTEIQTAQLLVKRKNTIHGLKLSNKSTFKVESKVIISCAILPDGKMIFADFDKESLLVYSRDGHFIRNINVFGQPASCAYVNNNQVAVSKPNEHTISLIDIENTTVQKISEARYLYCYDIVVEGRKLFVRLTTDNAVQVLDLDENAAKIQHVKIYGTYLLNISVFMDKIYCTNWKENTVYCYDMNDTELWTFQHQDLLHPRGIAVDNAGFVYVACKASNKLMVISPDGREGKVLLDEGDGLMSPVGLHINRELSLLLIGSERKAFLYTI